MKTMELKNYEVESLMMKSTQKNMNNKVFDFAKHLIESKKRVKHLQPCVINFDEIPNFDKNKMMIRPL
jgi:hypothetical protein